VPIVASFDMHCHMTDLMVSSADAIVVYRTHPHVDIVATGEHAMRMLLSAMRREAAPVVVHRKMRLVTSSEVHDHRKSPMKEIQHRARELERRPGMLALSISMTQPWLDVRQLGWSVVAVADADRDLALAAADEIGHMIWDARESLLVRKTSIPEALARVLSSGARPFVLSDGADAPSAGGGGDGTELLRALLEVRYADTALISITDPVVVAECFRAGVGAEVEASVGGRLVPRFSRSVSVRGRVKTLADGKFTYKYVFAPADVGRTAVLEVGRVSIVVTERPALTLDLELWRHVGLEPREFRIVQPKSAGGYRGFYEPIAAEVIDLDTTGPAMSDLTKLPFCKAERPLWPFDPDLAAPW
jgi:microcystin degradation protein MlrC